MIIAIGGWGSFRYLKNKVILIWAPSQERDAHPFLDDQFWMFHGIAFVWGKVGIRRGERMAVAVGGGLYGGGLIG